MKIKILQTIESIEPIEKEWRALCERTKGSVFCDYGYFKAWADHSAPQRGAMPHIVTAWEGERLVGLLSLAVYNKMRLRLLRFAGNLDFCIPLSLAENDQILEQLWHAAWQSTHYDFAELYVIGKGSTTHDILARLPSARPLAGHDIVTWINYAGMNGEAWRQTLDNSFRKATNRRMRNLQKTGDLSLKLYEGTIPSDLVDRMLELKTLWCDKQGYSEPVFDNPAFVRALIQNAGEYTKPLLACLSIDGTPIGFDLFFESGNNMYSYMGTYDPAWARFSPGTHTLLLACQTAADRGFKQFNFLKGRSEYKSQLINQKQEALTYSFSRTATGRWGQFLLSLRTLSKKPI